MNPAGGPLYTRSERGWEGTTEHEAHSSARRGARRKWLPAPEGWCLLTVCVQPVFHVSFLRDKVHL